MSSTTRIITRSLHVERPNGPAKKRPAGPRRDRAGLEARLAWSVEDPRSDCEASRREAEGLNRVVRPHADGA
jgi:hypothetical protein